MDGPGQGDARDDPQEVATAAGAVPVRAPRVNDKRIDEASGQRKRFSSAILPAWARKSPGVAEVLPLLYLHGLSSGDFVAALEQFLGSTAGLSAATITRLTAQWRDDAAAFAGRSVADSDDVYCWAEGIHLKVRIEQDKVCLLVMIGVRVEGTKELVVLADGFGESSESWADLLRDCKRRGMRAPVLAVGDGALGFSEGAARGVRRRPRSSGAGSTPRATSWRRCPSPRTLVPRQPWPRSSTPRTPTTLARPPRRSRTPTPAKWPQAVAKISAHLDVLLAFAGFPAEHWIHLRTTNRPAVPAELP